MTEAERKQALAHLKETKKPAMTGIRIKYNGEIQSFNAYQIPLDILTYNPYNGRIGSVVKSYERQHHRLDPENPEDVKIIEDFLWSSKVNANEATMASLLKDHQKQYGIVTADGKIIDGNRRASLLNRLFRDPSINANDKQHCRFFLAIILPQDADKKEIIRLETTYQMGEEGKVDYNPIEKYLKCGDLIEAGFTETEIAAFMNIKPREVMMYLRVLRLMDDYLETYGYEGMYTQLGKEDSFQKLDSWYRQYTSGGVSGMWDYDIEEDVADMKALAFDYIRLGFDQNDFRDIIRTPTAANPSSSLFACKDIWQDFAAEHFDIVDGAVETPVQEIIDQNPGADLTKLLRARDNAWISQVKPHMEKNYSSNKDRLNNRQAAGAPAQLLQKAISALTSVDTSQDTFRHDPTVRRLLTEIGSLVENYKNLLG